MKKLAVAIAVLAVLVWGGWLIAVPADVLEDMAEEELGKGRVHADLVGFRKGLFLSFNAEAVDIGTPDVRLLSVEDVSGGIEVFKSILGLKAVLAFDGTLGVGKLDGSVQTDGDGYVLDLSLKGTKLEKLGLFEHTGISGSAGLEADLHMRDGSGNIRFAVLEARLEPLRYRGTDLPLNLFHTARGALQISGKAIEVESVTLEGKGVYARAKGTVRGNMVEVKLEIMPDREVMPDALMSALLGRYKVSPGHYVIPVRQAIKF